MKYLGDIVIISRIASGETFTIPAGTWICGARPLLVIPQNLSGLKPPRLPVSLEVPFDEKRKDTKEGE